MRNVRAYASSQKYALVVHNNLARQGTGEYRCSACNCKRLQVLEISGVFQVYLILLSFCSVVMVVTPKISWSQKVGKPGALYEVAEGTNGIISFAIS